MDPDHLEVVPDHLKVVVHHLKLVRDHFKLVSNHYNAVIRFCVPLESVHSHFESGATTVESGA